MKPWIPYALPFFAFALLTYAGPVLGISPAITYPVKTIITGALLVLFFKHYRSELRFRFSLLDILAGIGVFVVWIFLDPFYPKAASPGFNPNEFAASGALVALIGFRMAGAVLVVPLMEELFWRSFAMRYLVNSNFKQVALGTFTWFSFGITALAFGIEHHRWLVGIIAGIVYGLLLVRSRNLFSPVVSHAVTNLLLGIYVVISKNWVFW